MKRGTYERWIQNVLSSSSRNWVRAYISWPGRYPLLQSQWWRFAWVVNRLAEAEYNGRRLLKIFRWDGIWIESYDSLVAEILERLDSRFQFLVERGQGVTYKLFDRTYKAFKRLLYAQVPRALPTVLRQWRSGDSDNSACINCFWVPTYSARVFSMTFFTILQLP